MSGTDIDMELAAKEGVKMATGTILNIPSEVHWAGYPNRVPERGIHVAFLQILDILLSVPVFVRELQLKFSPAASRRSNSLYGALAGG